MAIWAFWGHRTCLLLQCQSGLVRDDQVLRDDGKPRARAGLVEYCPVLLSNEEEVPYLGHSNLAFPPYYQRESNLTCQEIFKSLGPRGEKE
jgi:hypothetical protein